MTRTREPLRKCVGCGEMKCKKELIRVGKTPDGEVMLDVDGRLEGRGAYLCRRASCLEAALKRSSFERSLKARLDETLRMSLRKEVEAFEDG